MYRLLVILALLLACTFAKETTIEEHPYVVSVVGEWGSYRCGGSILGSRKVLTAANCCSEGDDGASHYEIQYGNAKLEEGQNVISVAKEIKHPGHNSTGSEYFLDICVLLLSDDIPLSNSSKPIELAKEEPTAEAKAVLIGIAFPQEVLEEVDVHIVAREACGVSWAKKNQKIDNNMVCTDQNVCRKGAPLVSDGKLVGVAGWMCDTDLPGVYANVAELRDWIDSL